MLEKKVRLEDVTCSNETKFSIRTRIGGFSKRKVDYADEADP